jgi:type IV pilus assembly protein PilX
MANTGERPHRSKEKGATMFVALTVLVITSLMAAYGLKAAIFNAGITNGSRARALALEAAENALRYCEHQITLATPAVAIQEVLPESVGTLPTRWKDPASWHGPAKLTVTVPESALNTDNSRQRYPILPECMAEKIRIPTLPGALPVQAVLITARGFSTDAAQSSNGQLTRGGEVWLQSTLQY